MASDTKPPVNSSSKTRSKTSNLVLSLIALYTAYVVYSSLSDGSLPEVPDVYWGKEVDPVVIEAKNNDASIRPFKVNVDEKAALNQLKKKLEEELKSSQFLKTSDSATSAGDIVVDSSFVQNIASYWKDSYKWAERAKALNKYPQFMTTINGLQVHFQRIKASDFFPEGHVRNVTGKNPRPLLLLHGWPNSFTEFQKLIPFLMDSEKLDFTFELVIPSLPGFGYSDGASKSGLGCGAMSHILLKLMQRMGHEIFYVHGSNDFGSFIATTMATLYPVNVIGVHLHQCQSKHPKSLVKHLAGAAISYFVMSSDESLRATGFYLESTGSTAAQFARPETISVALANSPTGLLSYILEMNSAKYNGQNMNVDDVLDNVMVYWLTNSIISASKIFSNQMNKTEQSYNVDSVPIFVPTMCTFYPSNSVVPQQSQALLSDKYHQILRYNTESQQSPSIIADNIIESFVLLENKGFAQFDRKHTCHAPDLAGKIVIDI